MTARRRRRDRPELTLEQMDELAATAGDDEWWAATGCCGGCGAPNCHTRRACTGPVCARCPSRDTP